MSIPEYRDLIEAVQKAGGPIGIVTKRAGPYITAPDWVGITQIIMTALNAIDQPDVQDRLAGVLKRDILTRGYQIDIGITRSNATTEIWPEDPPLKFVALCTGATELEALLHAWLDAARKEGWAE